MIQINPYRRNCEVIKKFFSKPIVLIISILLFLSVIASVSVEIITNNIPHIPIVSFISAIGFLRFYITGKSKSDNISFNAPTNLLTISSIISMVVNILALLLSALILILSYSGFNLLESNTVSYFSIGSLDIVFPSLLTSFVIYTPIFLLNILSAIAMLVLLSSFKKSSRSIYLYKKGSIFFALVSFALASAQIALIIYNGFSIQAIVPAVQAIISITLGSFSIKYNRYITNISSNVFVPQPTVETIDTAPAPMTMPITKPIEEPVQKATFKDPFEVTPITKKKHKPSKDESYDDALVGMWDDDKAPMGNLNADNEIESQPAFTQNDSEYNYPEAPILAMDEIIPIQHDSNYDAQPVLIHEEPPVYNKEELEAVENYPLFCPVCGTPCPPEHMFCANCGNKLNK